MNARNLYRLPVLSVSWFVAFQSLSAGAVPLAAAESSLPESIAPVDTPFPMADLVRPVFPDRHFNITAYGAAAGGKVKNTDAFRRAIAACVASGGGIVDVPAGLWLTGPIHLQSNVNLHLDAKAEIRFSTDKSDYLPVVFTRWEGLEAYNYSPLIYANGCTNIAITGKGTINGQGDAWWNWKTIQKPAALRLYNLAVKGVPAAQRVFGTETDALRPCFVEPVNCTNVLIEGITVVNGPMWTLHPTYCENVIVRGVTIRTNGPNTDGCNPDSCRNVLIEYCHFSTGDDCVAIKSGLNEDGWRVNRPSENIVVRHCDAHQGHGGVVIGSEMSGGVRNVYVHDCVFDGSDRGLRIKSMRGRGGIVENIWFQHVRLRNVTAEVVLLTMFYASSNVAPLTETPPTFRNIHVSDVTCDGALQAISIRGLQEKAVENVTFDNINIRADKGVECTDGKDLSFKNVSVATDGGPAFSFTRCTGVELADSSASGASRFLETKEMAPTAIRVIGARRAPETAETRAHPAAEKEPVAR